MARGTRHRFTVILLIAVLSLASLGFSYTLWAEDLSVAGTITTGEVDAEWMVGAFCSEMHTDPDDPALGFPGQVGKGEYLGKNVGSTSIGFDPNDPTKQTLILTITNGYPYYAVDCAAKYKNSGTVPWHIEGINVSPISGNLTNCTYQPAGVSPSGTAALTMICDQLLVTITDGITNQIHPCSEEPFSCWADTNVFVQILQPAAENATYTFSAGICVGQFNEDPTPGQCFAAAP